MQALEPSGDIKESVHSNSMNANLSEAYSGNKWLFGIAYSDLE